MWALKQDQNLPMATEKLKFKLELYATYWDKPPAVDVYINDEEHYSNDVLGTEKNPTLIEFEQSLPADQKYKLILKRHNKDKKQCIIDSTGKIVKDQLLHIKSLEIDEIDIGDLVYEGVYTPQYPEPWYTQQVKDNKIPPKTFKNVTVMGHNGSWEFEFSAPFYMWLLENLY